MYTDGYGIEYKWVQRVIVYFPEIDMSFNYTGQCEDIGLLFSNLNVFRICKEFSEVYCGWKYAVILKDRVQLLGLVDNFSTIHNFIVNLVLRGKVKDFPVLNLSKRCLDYSTDSCFSSYACELSDAWANKKGVLTRYRVLGKGNSVKIIYYKDYAKTEEILSAVLTVVDGNLIVSEVTGKYKR